MDNNQQETPNSLGSGSTIKRDDWHTSDPSAIHHGNATSTKSEEIDLGKSIKVQCSDRLLDPFVSHILT